VSASSSASLIQSSNKAQERRVLHVVKIGLDTTMFLKDINHLHVVTTREPIKKEKFSSCPIRESHSGARKIENKFGDCYVPRKYPANLKSTIGKLVWNHGQRAFIVVCCKEKIMHIKKRRRIKENSKKDDVDLIGI